MSRIPAERYNRAVMNWLPIPLRIGVVLIAANVRPSGAPPGAFIYWKFTQPGTVAGVIGGMGVPAPMVTNYVIGVIEVAFVLAVVLGLYARIPAFFMAIEMVFAIAYQGPVLNNVMMLTLASVIFFVGTGRLSVRDYNVVADIAGRFGAEGATGRPSD